MDYPAVPVHPFAATCFPSANLTATTVQLTPFQNARVAPAPSAPQTQACCATRQTAPANARPANTKIQAIHQSAKSVRQEGFWRWSDKMASRPVSLARQESTPT